MTHPARAAGGALLATGTAFVLLAVLPVTRTWGTATTVSGEPAVVSAEDALGVLSLRLLLSLVLGGIAMLAYASWRDRA